MRSRDGSDAPRRGRVPSFNRTSGFTLLELLVVAALAMVIAVAIYSNFSAGARLWVSLQGGSSIEDENIFYMRTSEDFEKAFRYGEKGFSGESDRISFMTGIRASEELGGDRGIGQVSYFFDKGRRVILREERDLSRLFKDSAGPSRVALQNVAALKLSYLGFEKTENAFVWQEAWTDPKGALPKAVQFDMTLDTPEGPSKVSYHFAIPAGGLE